MALNLRTITPKLHKRLKLAAFSSGKALERFCLEALEESLTITVFELPESWNDVEKHNAQAKTLSDICSYPLVANSGMLVNVKRPGHDSATCRLYGCGMCAVAKAK